MPAAPRAAARPPVIIAVDGRSGAGKTTLAVELATALREHRSVALFHLEDLYPGWDGLAAGIATYADRVLAPLRRGETARWRAWDWAAGREGHERGTEPADIVIVEGVGAGSHGARGLVDAVVWVEVPEAERKQRALARDGDTFAPHWDRWAAQEVAWLSDDDVPAAAAVTVPDGDPASRTRRTVDALACLPALREMLAPERALRDAVPLMSRRLPARPDAPTLFASLYGGSARAVWLDASDAGTPAAGPRSRFSVMADDGGALGRAIVHRGGTTEVSGGGVVATFAEPFFRWLGADWGRPQPGPEGLACGFALGWIGYLGYELKRECGGSDVPAGVPDAQLVGAGRGVVIDHEAGEVWLLALEAPDAAEWLEQAARAVEQSVAPVVGRSAAPVAERSEAESKPPTHAAPAFTARHASEDYLAAVRTAQAEIAEGNTYEVCLTTTLEARVPAGAPAADAWAAYRALRRRSPAPFAAFARFGPLAVASTSPERFLSISADGALRAEPIKGTRRRSPAAELATEAGRRRDAEVRAELAANPKDRAENLMIVDLLRNDLSHFAVPGSVAVSRLFAVESYTTVHQLVSTVDAQLRPGASRAEAIAAAFPPGSMTGAPKVSTMNILDRLERGPRGVYSGAIGYFSRTGAADTSVVIRTLVVEQADDGGARLALGVGGAVVADSDPADEYEEIRTKAFAVLSTLGAEFPG
ncbi:chorismate-binding protein [Sinomonas mesophila]|uniref:chorismate-binding protein n=1 Tax=Sinomonas mesophila TaxID=1531955 RepID=UPI0009874226|nr:chorismate-binding protein [Sinomonas mesophila]